MSIKNRGFASIADPEKRRELAGIGGRAAAKLKAGHRWKRGSEDAKAASAKGLQTRRAKK